MIFLLSLFCILGVSHASSLRSNVRKVNENTRLISYPMIMSHDAASGEISESRDHVVADWTKTQSVGLVAQLDCGVRSFDYRPTSTKDGKIYAHHGGITIHVEMKDSLRDIMKWANKHPDDLVVMYISHWDGDGCQDAVTNLLKSLSINTITECSSLSTLTYGEAKQASKLTGGGYLIAVYDCTNEYYDDSINCYSKDFTCYDSWPDNTKSIPFQALSTYMTKTTSSDPTETEALFWMAQAHWQSTAGSVTLGTLHNSSIVQDERRSEINLFIEQNILSGSYPYLNFLELDEVCDRGTEIYQAIKQVYL